MQLLWEEANHLFLGTSNGRMEALSATGTSLSPAAVTEAKNISQASSMRAAQLSGGSQQQGSFKLQSVASAVSLVSCLEGDAGSEVFPQTWLGQERSAVEGDQVGNPLAQPALLFCSFGSKCNARTCRVLRRCLSLPGWLSCILICQPLLETQPLAPWFLADFFDSGSHSTKHSNTSQPPYNRQTKQPTELLHCRLLRGL